MFGELVRSGIGKPIEFDHVESASILKKSCVTSNAALLKKLRDDEHSHELLEATHKDATLGRMTTPTKVERCDLGEVLLHPRFGVAQPKLDGSIKLRAVDHFRGQPPLGIKRTA